MSPPPLFSGRICVKLVFSLPQVFGVKPFEPADFSLGGGNLFYLDNNLFVHWSHKGNGQVTDSRIAEDLGNHQVPHPSLYGKKEKGRERTYPESQSKLAAETRRTCVPGSFVHLPQW